jgi:putative alpha-1,2-mannosidase
VKKVLAILAVSLNAWFVIGAEKTLTAYVNPFLGTAAPTNEADIGFAPPWKVWGGLTFPGASLPNAMVQLTPVTQFGSGAGYEYEDTVIHGFAHSCKGHWNLCYLPIMPVAGKVNPDDFGSPFSHTNESASPGFYQVFLDRYRINVELATTLRCGFHRYTFQDDRPKNLALNLEVSNERIRDWMVEPDGNHALKGFQAANEKIYFYAVANQKIKALDVLKGFEHDLPVASFEGTNRVLEFKIGVSYVSIENAKKNLETELAGKSF